MKRLLAFVLLFSTNSFSWGPVGHKTVAYIAEKNLSPSTLEKVNKILSPDSMTGCSMWADKTKNRYSAPWHYVDLPISQPITDKNVLSFYPDKKSNIIIQINKKIESLKKPSTPLEKKRNDLMFLIHFIGDLHMPLHCASNNDAGGNNVRVLFYAPGGEVNKTRTMTLHALWDNLIQYKSNEYPEYFGDILNNRLNGQQLMWTYGGPENWAVESYTIAKEIIYPVHTVDGTLPMSYYTKMRPIAEEQLLKAGIRLAFILEDIFK
jgi:hypothetical protein